MVIEFIGLMGAGKTTLHRGTVQRLKDQGRTVWTPRMLGEIHGTGRLAYLWRLGFRVRAAWRSRSLVALALRHLSKSGRAGGEKIKGLRWFLTSLGNRWQADQAVAPDQVALIDEGLGQRMFNIFIDDACEIDLAGVRRYARAQPLPDVLVYLTVHPDVAMARALTRLKQLPPRFRTLDRAQLSTMFANAASAFDSLVDEIRRTALTVNVLVIYAEDLTVARRELDDHIDAILALQSHSRQPAAAVNASPTVSSGTSLAANVN